MAFANFMQDHNFYLLVISGNKKKTNGKTRMSLLFFLTNCPFAEEISKDSFRFHLVLLGIVRK